MKLAEVLDGIKTASAGLPDGGQVLVMAAEQLGTTTQLYQTYWYEIRREGTRQHSEIYGDMADLEEVLFEWDIDLSALDWS